MNTLFDDSTKVKLIRAAIRVFAHKGYKGATIREICELAGAANLNSVNYYFGNKEGLYKTILDCMLSEHRKRQELLPESSNGKAPEERLCDWVRIYCDMIFDSQELAVDIVAIYKAEMTRPSPLFDEMIERHSISLSDEFLEILREILGSDTPRDVLRDCAGSIVGQIEYYTFAWPLIKRVHRDHPEMSDYRQHLAEHVIRFSLGGLKAIKEGLRGQ